MSDESQGPGWWQASDDKWYPPDQRPEPPRSEDGSGAESQSEASTVSGSGRPGNGGAARDERPSTDSASQAESGKNLGFGCLGIVVVVIVLSVLGSMCGGGDGDAAGGDDLEYGAFDVCTQFVEDRLLSPSSAEFPNEFEDDGEVIITSNDSTYTVESHVDSENGFGAMLQTPFTCVVRHTGGDTFRLVSLDLQGF